MDGNLNSFLAYYRATGRRLAAKMKKYNRSLRKDGNPVVRVFREDLADLNEGGKMLRGVLVTLGAKIAGAEDPEIGDDLALAFEILQTGILVHDDIIDRSSMRRGKITIHRRAKSRMEVRGTQMVSVTEDADHVAGAAAICAGDLGIYMANRQIAVSYAAHPALSDIITYFDDVLINTIRGELLDVFLPYEIQDSSYPEDEKPAILEKSIRDIYHLKTSCYSVIGPLHLGMVLAGAPEENLRAMDRAADDIGIAFQIMDDILGIYADSEILGKDVGSDISEFKQTILYMYVVNYRPEAAKKLLRYYGKEVTDERLAAVRQIFEETGALDYAKATMNACFDRAGRKLRRMKFLGKEDLELLLGFMDWCRGRRK